jgi:hypothetical protein
LIAIIKGFGNIGYNTKFIYLKKNLKDCYARLHFPSSKNLFEIHKKRYIYLRNTTFNGSLLIFFVDERVRNLSEILKIEPAAIDKFTPLEEWLNKTERGKDVKARK